MEISVCPDFIFLIDLSEEAKKKKTETKNEILDLTQH